MGFGSVSRTDCLFISRPSVLPYAKRGKEKDRGSERTKNKTSVNNASYRGNLWPVRLSQAF